MKQTAVDWIEQKIVERIVRRNPHNTIVIQTQSETLIELFEQAKAMEKEQIMDAFEAAEKDCGRDFSHGDLYYNETFKSE